MYDYTSSSYYDPSRVQIVPAGEVIQHTFSAGIPMEDATLLQLLTNYANTLKSKVSPQLTKAGGSVGEMFKNLGGFVKAHPYQSIGTGLNAAGNVAGILDNDKILGQGVGTALGMAAPKLLSKVPGPIGAIAGGLGALGKANLAMAGGNLGALFDSLRAKKEQEQAIMQQYGG